MSKVQCCGLCRYHKYMALGEFVCDNEDSECYGLSTHYDDVCEEDFKEKWKNTMAKRKENSEEKADYTFDTLEEIPELSLESSEDVSNNNCTKYLKSKDFSFELIDKGKKQLAEFMEPIFKIFKDIRKIFKRTFLCNNWRKKHHMPLIRWRKR